MGDATPYSTAPPFLRFGRLTPPPQPRSKSWIRSWLLVACNCCRLTLANWI